MANRPLMRAVAILALGTACGSAGADVYSWVDDAGVLNFGNVDPPAGARAQLVVKEQVPKPYVREGGASVPGGDVRALSERIRHLEEQAAADRSAAYPPPPAAYPPPPATYAQAPAYVPPPPAYQGPPVQAAWSAPYCDPSWSNCFTGWGPAFSSGSYAIFAPPYRAFGGWHHATHFGAAGRSFGGRHHR